MSNRLTKREGGFSLLEMMVAMGVGSIVLGAAAQLYIQGVNATWAASQQAELLQDFRAASDMLTRDLSLAGAGLNPGAAIALPSATTPRYGCDQTGACHLGNANSTAVNYPLQGGVTPTLYGLIPGYIAGPTLASNPTATDVVTVVYTDSSFFLNCYTATVTAAGQVTFGPATLPLDANGNPPAWPPAGCLPGNVTPLAGVAPQNVNDTQVGLMPGDLVYFPSLGGKIVVAEVTGGAIVPGTNVNGQTTYTVPFANNDALRMNQTPAAGPPAPGLNNVALNGQGTGPSRLLVITYYIDNTVTPSRLMREVSGHTPMPVVDGIVYMKFSYDLFSDLTSTPAISQNDGGASLGLFPNQITKINILHMAMDSTLKGTKGYQGMDLETSVSARNLTYVNNYAN
ncbi:MAG TPA: prepilin-type N-terminal cleavage/methylation domain-containing protein [Terriglobales bacterium]|nr:prepilin-type N-terminal cleavage/methylation domain-containing protein [Terriglobales bacterium]